jgi:hypothetical protein
MFLTNPATTNTNPQNMESITLTQLFCLLSMPPSSKAMTVQALAASSLATLVTLDQRNYRGNSVRKNEVDKQIPWQRAAISNHLYAKLPCGDDNQRLHRGPAKVDGGEDRQEIRQCLPGACLHHAIVK